MVVNERMGGRCDGPIAEVGTRGGWCGIMDGFGRVRKRGVPLLRRLNESSAGWDGRAGRMVWWFVEREKEGGVFLGFGIWIWDGEELEVRWAGWESVSSINSGRWRGTRTRTTRTRLSRCHSHSTTVSKVDPYHSSGITHLSEMGGRDRDRDRERGERVGN